MQLISRELLWSRRFHYYRLVNCDVAGSLVVFLLLLLLFSPHKKVKAKIAFRTVRFILSAPAFRFVFVFAKRGLSQPPPWFQKERLAKHRQNRRTRVSQPIFAVSGRFQKEPVASGALAKMPGVAGFPIRYQWRDFVKKLQAVSVSIAEDGEMDKVGLYCQARENPVPTILINCTDEFSDEYLLMMC